MDDDREKFIFFVGLLIGAIIGILIIGAVDEQDRDVITVDLLDSVCADLYGDGYIYLENGIGTEEDEFTCVKIDTTTKNIINRK